MQNCKIISKLIGKSFIQYAHLTINKFQFPVTIVSFVNVIESGCFW